MSEITNEAVEQELTDQVEQQQEQLETFSKSDIEEIAKANGWKEDGPNDALTYMKNGGVYRRQHVNTINELKEQVSRMETVLAEQVFRTAKSEEQRIKDAIKAAVDEGDSTTAIKLTEQLGQISRPLPTNQNTDAVIQQWIEENKWYSDPKLKRIADGLFDAERVHAGAAFDTSKALRSVTEAMQDVIPKPANQNRERASGETGGKRATGKGGLTVRDLTAEEAAHFQDFVKMGIPEENLLRSITKARGMA